MSSTHGTDTAGGAVTKSCQVTYSERKKTKAEVEKRTGMLAAEAAGEAAAEANDGGAAALASREREAADALQAMVEARPGSSALGRNKAGIEWLAATCAQEASPGGSGAVGAHRARQVDLDCPGASAAVAEIEQSRARAKEVYGWRRGLLC